jgi:hypothetical protein
MLEREGVPVARGGVIPLPAIWVEGFGARLAPGTALPLETNAAAFEEPGFAAGFGAGLAAGTGPRDPVEGRFASRDDELGAGLDPGLATGLGADGTPEGRGGLAPREAIDGEGLVAGFEDGRGAVGMLLVGFDPRETIEGEGLLDGLETGFAAGLEDGRGAGREAIEGLREMLDEREGEARLIEGALGRGVTRETEGARDTEGAREGCRTATGGLENPGLLETLGRDIGAMGLEGIERGADARGAEDWERPPEEPPPEFR